MVKVDLLANLTIFAYQAVNLSAATFCLMMRRPAGCRFHELRKTHPRIASKRKVNETLYASMGVRTGWFCGARPLRDSIATIKVCARAAVGPCLLTCLSSLQL